MATRKKATKATKAKTKTKTKAKAKAKAKAPAEVLVVGSKVKAAIKAAGCNTGGDSIGALNAVVHQYIAQATARAQANGRKTVRGHDFYV